MLARKIENEIKNINRFEHQWKIKTNTNKFTILPLAIIKTEPVTINNNIIPYSNTAKILGLTLTKNGYRKHIKEIKNKASIALSTLRRFRNINPKIKVHLIKSFVLPIFTYPAYSLNSISNTDILTLQRVQNKALRFATRDENNTYTTEQLHIITNTQPINIILHNRG